MVHNILSLIDIALTSNTVIDFKSYYIALKNGLFQNI